MILSLTNDINENLKYLIKTFQTHAVMAGNGEGKAGH